jgi:hypothetical protein
MQRTADPFPLETPGALGYSPLFSFPFALLSTLRVGFNTYAAIVDEVTRMPGSEPGS